MTLSEQRIIKQVTVQPETQTIQVQWADQILRGDEVVTETYFRRAYSESDKSQFESDLGDQALPFMAAVGW